jgi:pimeloyl-ACP methyl ester carboxylesterase
MAEKPFLLLLPGLLCDETIWAPQLAGLEGRARMGVAAYPDATSLAEMAERALAIAPERFLIAGHSMGGRVAFDILALLAQRGETGRLAGLALLDTAYGPRIAAEVPKRMALVDIARRQGMKALADAWLPPMVHPARLPDRALMDPLETMICRMTPQNFAGQINALLTRRDATPLLARIAVPTLVLCGNEDAWRGPQGHAEMAGHIKGATLDIVPDCGHMAPVERPEAVNAALARWLARVAAKDEERTEDHAARR